MSKQSDRELLFFGELINDLYRSREVCLVSIVASPIGCLFLFLLVRGMAFMTGGAIIPLFELTFLGLIILALVQTVRLISINRTIWLVKCFQSHYSEEIEDDPAPDDLPGLNPF